MSILERIIWPNWVKHFAALVRISCRESLFLCKEVTGRKSKIQILPFEPDPNTIIFCASMPEPRPLRSVKNSALRSLWSSVSNSPSIQMSCIHILFFFLFSLSPQTASKVNCQPLCYTACHVIRVLTDTWPTVWTTIVITDFSFMNRPEFCLKLTG